VITIPKRPVTRFFVPLIDVLILLFCIFLLMPFVSRPEAEKPGSELEAGGLPTDVAALQEQLKLARKQVDDLWKDRQTVADKLNVRVLEIDADNGRLFYFNRDGRDTQRQEIPNQAAAQLLIDRARQTSDGKKVFFMILYPRRLSGYPEKQQIADYRRWFKDTPHGFDNPWADGS